MINQRIRSIVVLVLAAVFNMAAQAQSPKYIFYFIGDGMGMGPVMAAENYNRLILGNDQPLLMMQFPTVSWCQTYSASSTTTDSAAAGTALSTGSKTKNGMLGMDADSIPVTSIAKTLHDSGWGVGLVTTVAADDATPGAFYAHVPTRHMSYEIDLEVASSGYEFIAGAGLKGLDSKHHDEVAQAFERNGVQLVYGPSGINRINSRRVVLLGTERGRTWNVGYTVDSIAGVLTLPMMTQACLSHLTEYAPEHFFMMVEGGNIDHALHANDGGTAVKEILNFNESLQIAYDFYLAHPDETLIIVTADHDTGGLAMGNNTVGYKSYFENVTLQRKSKEIFSEECKSMLESGTEFSWNEMKQKISRDLGLFDKISVTEEQEKKLNERFEATFRQRNTEDQKTLYANFDAFAVAVYNLFNELTGYGFTSTGHTGNPVPLFAIGKGSDLFNGLNNNIDIVPVMKRLTNLDTQKN